jgi:signal transduction histidine kinase
MYRSRPTQRLADYLTVGEAADFLGVSTWTLRNWDKAGKLKPLRHPKNGYRIYRHEDLEAILQPAALGAPKASPEMDWSNLSDSEHFVQFYDSDEYLTNSVSSFLGSALRSGQGGIVVATRAHRSAIQQKLKAEGLDLTAMRTSGQYIALDAAETLSKFMVNGSPDPNRFDEVVGNVIRKTSQQHQPVRAFGEMVAILWKDGNRDAAIRLEELWNELGKSHAFALYCAYPIRDCGSLEHEAHFDQVCTHHTRVIPAESYAGLTTDDERLRLISTLQQKAHSLAAEIAHRQEVEKALTRHEQVLREQDRRKDEFLAMLAHELRNPLAPISNALEMMKLGNNDAEVIEESRHIMERQVRQMVRIVDDLLDVSRITRGKLELRPQRINLREVINNAVETSRPLIESRNHQLKVDMPAEPILLEADLTRLAQVFSNLLNNSAKYTEPGGDIRISAELASGEIIVRVKDNGIGIASDSLATIFEMFQQVDSNRDRAQCGLGIGLTLVKRLVELHGGKIDALSAGLGQGSEFVVRLPVGSGRIVTTSNQQLHGVHVSFVPKRILVVDDNQDSANSLSSRLRFQGHDVCTVHDGLAAIEVGEAFQPHLILMDVGMPRLNGYEATTRIRQRPWGKDIEIIALTGWGNTNDIDRSRAAGCTAHLVKPVDFAALDELLA